MNISKSKPETINRRRTDSAMTTRKKDKWTKYYTENVNVEPHEPH